MFLTTTQIMHLVAGMIIATAGGLEKDGYKVVSVSPENIVVKHPYLDLEMNYQHAMFTQVPATIYDQDGYVVPQSERASWK